MANVKFSELPALAATAAVADLVPITDISTTQTKRATVGEIVGVITGDVVVSSDGTATIGEKTSTYTGLPVSKLANGTSRQLLQTNSAGGAVEWTDDIAVKGKFRISTKGTIASATATGITGDIIWDENYIYVCIAANTWKRAAIATWS